MLSIKKQAAALALIFCQSGALAAPPDDPELIRNAAALRDAALQDDRAYALTETIVTEFGPRPAGSANLKRALQWAADELDAMGFDTVAVEEFPVRDWFHGEAAASVVAPFPQELVITALGGSVATPEGGLEAEIALFKTYDDLLATPEGGLKGKIAVVTETMPKSDSGDGYFSMGRIRSAGATEAAKRGAVAFLMRSLSTAITREPHTGGLNYRDGAPKIPAAALAPPDAELLDRMAVRKAPIRIRMKLTPTASEAGLTSQNIIADNKGAETPEEIVLVGAHIDSWDTTPGALDNASGVAIIMSAAKLIKDKFGAPRRTIRVVIFGAEEIGGVSGRAYAKAHHDERLSYVFASESDSGASYLQEIKLPGNAASTEYGETFAALVKPLGTRVSSEPSTYGGVDVNRLTDVPFVSMRADLTDYFDVHHGADDTLDKVSPEDIRRSVAAWATLIYLAADSDADFREHTD